MATIDLKKDKLAEVVDLAEEEVEVEEVNKIEMNE